MARVRVAQHVRKNPRTGKAEIVKEYFREIGGEKAAAAKGVKVDEIKRLATKADKGKIPNAEFRARFASLKKVAPTPSANVPSADSRKKAEGIKGKPQLTGDTKMVNGKKWYKLTNGQWTDDPTKFTRLKGFGKIHLSDDEEALILSQSDEGLENLTLSDRILELSLRHESLNRSPRKNWVENTGQLPAYIQHIANDLHKERGMPLSRAIPTAISLCKKWAAGGKDVKPDTRAKAAAAIAEWERLKMKNKARKK